MITIIFCIREVANLLGVGKSTIINWENSGHIPEPDRDAGGNRVYSAQDVINIAEHLTDAQRSKASASVSKEIEVSEDFLDFLKKLASCLAMDGTLGVAVYISWPYIKFFLDLL